MGHSDDPGQALTLIRGAFGCGWALAARTAALCRANGHPQRAMRWPWPDRDEATLLVCGEAREVAYVRDGSLMWLQQVRRGRKRLGTGAAYRTGGHPQAWSITNYQCGAAAPTESPIKLLPACLTERLSQLGRNGIRQPCSVGGFAVWR